MKYNDNGEYKDIYIKTFDTLPVGTEVDYDGSVVPDGWSEISESYTLTNTPAHSAGTNVININKIGNLVVMNFNIWINSLTANTWTNIGTFDDEIVPTALYGIGVLVSGDTGNKVGDCLIGLNNGILRIKPSVSQSSLTGIQANITYVI